MKTKISRIWGVGLVIVLAASLLLAAAPVSAGTLSWSSETIPSTSGKVLQDGANVTDIAVADDGTIYAVTGADNFTYKSVNGGVSWSKMTQDFGAPVDLIAVAPDDSDVVAVSSNITGAPETPVVWISKNGGSTWGTLGTPAGTTTVDVLRDMSISATAAGINYLAVAGETVGNVADVWVFNIGDAAPAWKSTSAGAGETPDQTTGLAVAYSPNFASDYVMTAVTANATNVSFQMWSESSDAWNASGASFSSYPVTILNGTTPIPLATAASIALSPDYLGSDDTMRIAFVGLTTTAGTYSGVFRLKNTTDKVIDDGINIHSIDYDGTNLVAGATDDHNVRRSDDPLATTPSFSSAGTYKRPGMTTTTNVVVAWNGADVVAGTSGTGSAFSVSTDNGKSFNDISLIDAANMGTMLDVAVAADGSKVYMLANDGNALSLWRKDSSWARVLALASADDYIIRIAPDDPDTVYVALTGAKSIYYSSDGGETKWFARTTRALIQDLTVEAGGDVAYMAVDSAATVSKTTNTGFTWGTAKATGVTGNINMIASLSEDNLIVGSATGYVAWSTDGNSSWTANSVALNGGGLTQVTASGLADGDFIYASSKSADATASLVERWEIGQSGTTWKDLAATFTGDNYSATGISLTDGVLYVLSETSTTDNNSAVLRTLSPSTAEPSTGMWSSMASADEAFSALPTALRVSAGSNKLWAVDKDLPKLWSYSDTLSTAGPSLVTPIHGAEVQINPVSGSAYTQAFSWNRPSKATIYQLRVALDYDFTEIINTFTTASTTDDPVAEVVGPGAANALEFMPNTTYYWKVRVAQAGPVFSPWSAVRMFTIGALPEIQPPVEIVIPPAAPAPQLVLPPTPAPVPAPEIIVQTPPPPADIIIPPAPAPPAPITPAFIWAIVIIGAILVIAVVVLIVRTRRPV